MKRKIAGTLGLAAGLAGAAALLGGPAALAAGTPSKGSDVLQAPWQAGHPVYQATAPARMKCLEFNRISDTYRNYVVAWLDGYSEQGKLNASQGDINDFMPRSVLAMQKACKAHPDQTVMAAAQKVGD